MIDLKEPRLACVDPTHVFGKITPKSAHILAFHGYGGGIDGTEQTMAPLVRLLTADADLTVSLARYRNRSRDNAGLPEMCEDAATALSQTARRLPDDATLYLLGASFGAILAVDALLHANTNVQGKIAGLILMNPVVDIGPNGFSNQVVSPLLHRHLSPIERLRGHPILRRMRCLILHGEHDEIIPISAARRFAALWPDRRVELIAHANCGHGFFNRPPHAERVVHIVRNFVGAPPTIARRVSKPPPPPTPRNARIRWPKGASLLYGIGAQKAGTTWLFDCLRKSAQCHTTQTKELHYFNVLFQKSEVTHLHKRLADLRYKVGRIDPAINPENRKQLRHIQELAERLMIHAVHPGEHHGYVTYLLKGYADQPVVCDFTPAYATLEREHFVQMAQIAPAKFVFILRDPVDRLWSEIRMGVEAAHPELAAGAFLRACKQKLAERAERFDLALMPRCDYNRTITALEEAIPQAQIFYGFYEELFTQKTIDAFCRFLDIEPLLAELKRRSNPGRAAPLSPRLERQLQAALMPQYIAMQKRFGTSLPTRWQQRLT